VLHVRVVSPREETARLVAELTAHAGVQNLVVLKDAAHRPGGDAVQFDVQNRSANPVLRELRRRALDSRGSITVGEVHIAISGPPSAEAERRYARRERVPVWEMVEGTIRAGAAYPPSFYLLLIIAGLIGAVGILTNSQILVVGAMVVGPEYSAIIAAALGISNLGGTSRRDWPLVREAARALLVGFLAAVAVTFLFSLAVRGSGQVPAPFLDGVRPVAELINSPNVFSVIVAILAGLVGVVSLTESRANALIGVFISVTTIPAAASLGLSLAFANWHDAEGSLWQLLLNVLLLVAVGAAGLSAQRLIWAQPGRPGRGPRSQDRDRVDRRAGPGGQPQRGDDAQERPPARLLALRQQLTELQVVQQVHAQRVDGQHMHRELHHVVRVPGAVVVAVAAEHRDLPVGDELHRRRVQPSALAGRVPRAELEAPPPVPHPDEQQIPPAHLDLLRGRRAGQVIGRDMVARLQPRHPAQPGDVQQHAAPDDAVLGHGDRQGGRARPRDSGRGHPVVQVPVVHHMAQRVQVAVRVAVHVHLHPVHGE
jgi:uncharacterized hydrophobic protein (TIGR00271 family)